MVDEPSRYEWDRLVQTMDAGFAGVRADFVVVHGRLDEIAKAQAAAAVQAQDHESRIAALEDRTDGAAASPRRESALMAFALVAGAAILKIAELLFSGAAHAVVSAFTLGRIR